MPTFEYDSVDLYVTLSKSEMTTITSESKSLLSGVEAVIGQELSACFTTPKVAEVVKELLSEYFDKYAAVLNNANQGYGVKIVIPWASLADGKVDFITTSTIRRIRPRPLKIPDNSEHVIYPPRPLRPSPSVPHQ